MATQNINIGINVSDNGTAKKVVQSFKEITQAATQAQQASQSIKATPVKSTLTPGGTSGSRMVAASMAPSERIMSGEDYGRARGAAGATGASARDFANQAQGLGGLVRLYATLAANVFAASAAFTALKNAADTTNLVRGLDTLGAASGQALGSLSKRLVEVTDGAISMREAMTATAQASSAGMSGKNIERLALVAKNASLALGVAMPDALSRLSRGIVKLEPELLDELGLFTKIGPATERYALEIGKSVNALSDFERRQAFANAVLEEGEKKFGALAQAAANPYDKLLANLKNVIQSGLELVNKVLVPIVSLLAESPAALGAVLAGIGVVLLKQALPAIGQLRAGLKNSAEEALKTAEAFKESFGDEFQTILEKRFKIPDLQADIRKTEQDLAKLKFPGKVPESLKDLQAGELNQKKINSLLETRNATIETGMRGSKKASDAQIEQAKQQVAYIEKEILLYKQKKSLAEASEGSVEAASGPLSRLDAEIIAQRKYKDLKDKVVRADIISNAAQVSQIAGVRVAYQLLNQEIAEKGVTGFAKYSTVAQGTLAAVGTRVMGIISSFAGVGQAIGLAVAGFMLLDSWFTSNSKQAEKFSKSLTTAEEAMSNIARTISAATTTEGFATRTIANTVAFSNALSEVTSSLSEVIKVSREADKAANSWDKFWDGLFSFVGRDRASKLAKNVAKQIQSSIDLLSREGLAEAYKQQVQKILQVDNLESVEQVTAAFKALNKEQQNALISIQENSNRALGNAGSALQNFKDKTDEALKAQKVLSNSFLDSSPAFKYGEGLIAVSNSLNELITQGPERVSQALQELSANMEKAAMFGPEFVSEFGKISSEFGKQKAVIDGLSSALVTYKKELSLANTAAGTRGAVFTETPGAPSAARGTSTLDIAQGSGPRQQASIANSTVRELQKALAAAPRDAVDKSLKLVEAAAKSLFDRGMAFIGKAVRDAQTTASITIGKVLTSNLTGPQKLQADAAYAQQELKARLADISISEQMMDTQTQLVNEMKLANALQAEANVLQKNAGKTDIAAIEENKRASKEVAKAQLGAAGVGAAGMLNSDLLDEQEKAKIRQDQARQKMVQQAALQPAKILAKSQLEASQLSLRGDLPIAQAQQEEELKKITDRTTASLISRQDIMSSIASVTSAEVIKNRQSAELTEKAVQQNRELGAINDKIAQAEGKYRDAVARGDADAQKGQLAQINFLEQVKQRTEQAQAADTSLITAKGRQQLLTQELLDIDKRYETLRSTSELENQTTTSRLDVQSQLLAIQSQAGQYSQTYVINTQTALDKEKALLDLNIAQQQAQDTLAQKREASEARIAVLKADGAVKNKAAIDAETAELTRQQNLTNNTVAGLTLQYNNKVAVLEKSKEINLEQERYNLLIESSNNLAENLTLVFKDLGSSVGGVVSAMVNLAVQSEKNNKLLADNAAEQKKLNDIDDPLGLSKENQDKLNRLKQEEITLNEKSTKAEMANASKVAGAAKKVFKEKTAAHKAFAALEKGTQLASLAMELKTMAGKIGAWWSAVPVKAASEGALTAVEGAGAAARAPLTFGQIVGQYLKSIPAPWGMIAGAAAGAYFLRLIGKGGGGGSPAPFTATSEQLQQTQGTGMTFNALGEKVATGGGILGDDEAKANSVVRSLEILKDNSFKSLSYDNKLLRSFQSISDAIGKATNVAVTSGLRTVPTELAATLGTSKDKFDATGIGLIDSLLGGVLGGNYSETRTLQNRRLELQGTFDSVSKDMSNSLKLVTDVLVDWYEDGGWFGSDSGGKFVQTSVTSVTPELQKAFKDVMGYFKEGYEEIAAQLKKDDPLKFVTDKLKTIALVDSQGQPLKLDLMGLNGADEIRAEIEAYFSQINNIALKALFPEFQAFETAGEDYGTTVIRIIQQTEQVRLGLLSISSAFDLLSRGATNAYEVAELLIKGAAGLDKFVDQMNFFSENFLTEAERLVPVQKAVTAEMNRLGFANIKTRDQFKLLVQGLDLNTKAGRDNYQALMDVQEGFIAITEAMEDKKAGLQTGLQNTIDKFDKFGISLRSFRDGLLLGSQSILSPLEKYTEAKMQYETTFAKALAGDEKAQGEYQSAAQTFLSASGNYFASSGQYIKDFNKVLEDTKLGITETESQINIAKKQLGTLESIDANIAILAGVPQLAAGGRASGLTIVGERGPELVDFSYPGRVYPADQTRGMFAPQATMSSSVSQVVQELRQVKQELAQLRKEQQQQTGDLIVSNYDANNRAAEAVTTEVANAATLKEWQQRNKAAVI